MNNYGRFYAGSWKSSMYGFNGRMVHATLRIGRGSYIYEMDAFTTWLEKYQLPEAEELGYEEHEVVAAEDSDPVDHYEYVEGATESE